MSLNINLGVGQLPSLKTPNRYVTLNKYEYICMLLAVSETILYIENWYIYIYVYICIYIYMCIYINSNIRNSSKGNYLMSDGTVPPRGSMVDKGKINTLVSKSVRDTIMHYISRSFMSF
jgi:hypothetical protein